MILSPNPAALFLICFLMIGSFSLEMEKPSKPVTIPMDFVPWSAADNSSQFAGEYIVTITIGGQELKAFVDTFFDGSWALNESCTTCHSKGVPKYSTARSPSFSDSNKDTEISYTTYSGSHTLYGRMGYEKFGYKKYSNLSIPFVAVRKEDKDSLKFYNDSEATLGLGRRMFEAGGILSQMKDIGLIDEKKIGMAFSKGGQSELTFGGYNEDKVGNLLCELSASDSVYNSWNMTLDDGLYIDNKRIYLHDYAVIASDTPYIIISTGYAYRVVGALSSLTVSCAIDFNFGFIICHKATGKFTMSDAKSITVELKKTKIEIAKEDLVQIDPVTGVATYRIMTSSIPSAMLILGSPFLYNHYFVEQKNSSGYLKMYIYSFPDPWYVVYKTYIIYGGIALGAVVLLIVLICICKKCRSRNKEFSYASPPRSAPTYKPPSVSAKRRIVAEAESQPAVPPPRRITAEEVLLGMIAGALTIEIVAQKLFAFIQETLQQNAHLGRAGQKVVLLSMIKALPEILEDPAFQSFTANGKEAIIDSVCDKISQAYGD